MRGSPDSGNLFERFREDNWWRSGVSPPLWWYFSATVLMLWVHPLPRLGGEFSYLPAEDEFADGRWTNPSDRWAIHFESLHIIRNPTYASKFHTVQGLMLATGKLFTYRPLARVWLSVGLATALCWMFPAWLPPSCALLDSLMVGFRLSWGHWGQSYWGGGVTALGGLSFRWFAALKKRADWMLCWSDWASLFLPTVGPMRA